MLGFQDSFSNHFGQTYSGIIENWESSQVATERISALLKRVI